MSKARSPRAVCSTTIGTKAMCGLLLLRLMSVTLLLYVDQAIVGSFFFAVPGEFAEVYGSISIGKSCLAQDFPNYYSTRSQIRFRPLLHPCLDLQYPQFEFRRKLLQDLGLCGV